MSYYQTRLLLDRWGSRGHWIVLVGDADAKSDWMSNAGALRRGVQDPGRVVVLFPDGKKDLGEMTEAEAWGMIGDAIGK